MRGHDEQQPTLFSYISLEERVPQNHPLRDIRKIVDGLLQKLSPRFAKMYSPIGRPSIPPEKLLRALLLQVLYTIRSERQLMEQLDYNLLYRWFVGLNIDEAVWDPTTFTQNRDRFLTGDIATAFFNSVLAVARSRDLLSEEHFSVDGSLIEAWASHKSFKPKDGPETPPAEGGRNNSVNFRGERRTNETHQSATDPEARLYKKSSGQEAKLCYMGHILIDNRHGLLAKACVTQASGTAEREAALQNLRTRRQPRRQRVTVAGDKNYDTQDFVDKLRRLGITPHVAQNDTRRRSAIDGRTTRHVGYRISQTKRKLVEQFFGWMKTIGLMRKTRHRGQQRVNWVFNFTAAVYNLIRIRNLGWSPC
jgi:transposase